MYLESCSVLGDVPRTPFFVLALPPAVVSRGATPHAYRMRHHPHGLPNFGLRMGHKNLHDDLAVILIDINSSSLRYTAS